MRIFRTKTGCVVEQERQYFRLTGANWAGADWDNLLAAEDLHAAACALIQGLQPSPGFHAAEIVAPIGLQEVWAAGVTYYRSRGARME